MRGRLVFSFCQKKKIVIVARWISRARELCQWKQFHFWGSSLPTRWRSSLNPVWSLGHILILLWNLKKKIGLCVVCRKEVALFVTLPALSIREKEALSVPPSPPFWQTAKNSSGLPLVWGLYVPKSLICFISGRDKFVLVFCFRVNQTKPRNRKGRCLDFGPRWGMKVFIARVVKSSSCKAFRGSRKKEKKRHFSFWRTLKFSTMA